MSADIMLPLLTPVFLDAVDSLSEASFAEPTSLPGWTRAHVIAHVHSNAEALRRLVGWARTGEESRMYASAAQRSEEIESGARLEPEKLRALVHESAVALTDDLAELTGAQRANLVITAQGRSIAAAEIPWLRCRELGVHAVDLGAGVTFADLPEEFLAALVQDVIVKRTADGELAMIAVWLTGRAPTKEESIGAWL
jgi:maleylpyruvate isomerase